jgi:ubiquinone/menaquinone biosynthesis C-methylase UbiE
MSTEQQRLAWSEVGRRLEQSDCAATSLFEVTATAAPTIIQSVGLTRGQRLLEVGCGRGDLLAYAATLGVTGVGIDIAPSILRLAEATYPGLRVSVGDAVALPFDACTFDAVVCSFTLGFVPDRSRAVIEALRVLRPGGCYALTTWLPHESGFLRYVADAVRRHGSGATSDERMHHTYPDASYYEELLRQAGFQHVQVANLSIALRCATPEGVLDVLRTAGASRAMVESQSSQEQALIRAELVSHMRPDGTLFSMPMPALLFTAYRSTV